MQKRRALSLHEFTVEIQATTNRINIMCVNIHENGKFNMNGKLAGKLGGKWLRVAFLENAKSFAMWESDDEAGIKFPKSGSYKLEQVIDHLKKQRIPMPAKYEVWYNEKGKFWQGDYVENPTIAPSGKHRSMKKN